MGDNTKIGSIPKRVLYRMSIYHRHLQHLDENGDDRVSSKELAEKAGVTASQLRQDLHYFGSFGQQGYGYRVDELLSRIRRIIGLDKQQNMVLIGAGRLGQALASYENFNKRGFKLVGVFDSDPDMVGADVSGVPVRDIVDLDDFLLHNRVDVGIITVPVNAAQSVADALVKNGIDAIWNFAPLRLTVPPEVMVEHAHLTDSLVSLTFAAKLKRESRSRHSSS